MRPAPKLPLAPGLGWTKDFMRRQSSSRALMGRISCKAGAHTGTFAGGLHLAFLPILSLPFSSVTAAALPAHPPRVMAQLTFHDPSSRTICGSPLARKLVFSVYSVLQA